MRSIATGIKRRLASAMAMAALGAAVAMLAGCDIPLIPGI